MVVELKGQQIRIRVRSVPKHADEWGTHDVGKEGRLQRVAYRKANKWYTQAWRVNLRDYSSYKSAMRDIKALRLKGAISKAQYNKASKIAFRWFNAKR